MDDGETHACVMELYHLNIDKLIRALGLRENFNRELAEGVVLTLDITKYIDPTIDATLTAPIVPTKITRVVLVPTPSIGGEWTLNVPAGVRWNVRMIDATLTNVTLIAKFCDLIITDAAGNATNHLAQFGIAAAAATQFFSFIFSGVNDNQQPRGAGAVTRMAVAPMELGGGSSIRSSSGVSATDQWSAIRAIVEEIPDI